MRHKIKVSQLEKIPAPIWLINKFQVNRCFSKHKSMVSAWRLRLKITVLYAGPLMTNVYHHHRNQQPQATMVLVLVLTESLSIGFCFHRKRSTVKWSKCCASLNYHLKFFLRTILTFCPKYAESWGWRKDDGGNNKMLHFVNFNKEGS